MPKPTKEQLLQEAIEAFEAWHKQRGYIYEQPGEGSRVTKRRVWLVVQGKTVAKYDWKQKELEIL